MCNCLTSAVQCSARVRRANRRAGDNMDPTQLEEFKNLSALLTSYLTLVMQTMTLAMPVAGGMAAYAIKGDGKRSARAYALILPAALCGGLGAGFLLKHAAAVQLEQRLAELTVSLHFGVAPHASILVNALA